MFLSTCHLYDYRERNTGIWDEVSVSIIEVSYIAELPSMTIDM